MENQENQLGFAFLFSSKDEKLNDEWNESDWDYFNSVPYVPIVGDIINFKHIFLEVSYDSTREQQNVEGYETLLIDFKTYLFKVTNREFRPFDNWKTAKGTLGVWHLYYLTIEPVDIPDISREFQLIQSIKERYSNSNQTPKK